MIDPIHPSAIYLVGALLTPLLKGIPKRFVLLLVPIVAFVDLLCMRDGHYWKFSFLGYQLIFGHVDKLGMAFAYVFVIVSLAGFLYALHVRDNLQHASAMCYVGSALGLVFAGDLFTMFVFWKVMAIASTFVIWSGRSKEAIDAGFRYLMVHLFGGAALLTGIAIYASQTGSIVFGPLEGGGAGFWFILVGFMLNAAVPPLHPWLPDAYPAASVTGAVFLTAYTTKSAVYALLRAFPGLEALAYLGAVMSLYGVVWAIIENDMRRLLSYHIISQVGYMVAGVGIGTGLSLDGAAAHAFCHILYKALLFMGAGAVIHATGLRKMNELAGRGLYYRMPLTLIFYMIGAFSISSVPLFNGFVSKDMIVKAAEDVQRIPVFFLLHLASIGTWLCVAIKLPYYTWFGKARTGRRGTKANEPPLNMILGMGLLSALCIGIGIYPEALYRILPYQADFHPYTPAHIFGNIQLLSMAAVATWLLRDKISPRAVINLDTDWFYRKGAAIFVRFCYALASLRAVFQGVAMSLVNSVIRAGKNPLYAFDSLLAKRRGGIPPYDAEAYRQPIGRGVMVSLILFCILCLVLFAHLAKLLE